MNLDWFNPDQPEGARLAKFDSWCREQLRARLQWPADEDRAAKLREQCRIEILNFVRRIWQRGWLLDGTQLAPHITRALDRVGEAQRKGDVRDFWPFYHAVMQRYVGTQAEEIQGDALRAGSTMGQVLSKVLMNGQAHSASATELIGSRRDETLAAKQSAWQASERARRRSAGQMELL